MILWVMQMTEWKSSNLGGTSSFIFFCSSGDSNRMQTEPEILHCN